MIYSIISIDDIFYNSSSCSNAYRSSNPYDYIRTGYYIDNVALFGGKNNVDFNFNIPSHRTGNNKNSAHI